MSATGWLTLLVLAAAPGAAAGQGLRGAVLEGGDGTVRLSFPAREGVLFCDEGIRLHGGTWVAGEGRRREDSGCAPGPVRVELEVGDGAIRRVATLHGRRGPTAVARELGTVDPREAQEFFLALARSPETGRGGSDAVFPAILADVPEGWRGVMELATDTRAPAEARKGALFWMGQEAAAAATEGLASVAADENEDQRVREAAVFALSQRPPEEGVPVLMELARTAREARTRRSAFFWLSQSSDPRVPAFFRDTILGGHGG